MNILTIMDRMRSISIESDENTYQFTPMVNVPRVTRILDAMINEKYIAQWANSLGFKRISYNKALSEAASKGTYTHNAIEKLLKNNEYLDITTIPLEYRFTVENTYSSFLSWYNIIKDKSKLIFSEKTLICKYFGGTLDCLMEIDGKLWIIDFKTSNHMSYRYLLQLSAYRYMLKKILNIEVDGCLVLMLSKDDISFREYIIDLSDLSKKKFMSNCEETFFALTYAYYKRYEIENLYKEMF